MKHLFLALSLFFSLSSIANAQWTNEPAGSTNVSECAFPLSSCAGWYDGYNTPYANDPSDPKSPPTVADFVLYYQGPCPATISTPQNCAVGGGQFGYIRNSVHREMYVGLYFKLSSPYGCSAVGASKTFFMRAQDITFGGPRTNGVFFITGCGSSHTWIFSHNTGDQPGYPALHNEHACPEDPWNGLTCRQNMSSLTFQDGQWVKVEACIRPSTNMTSRDGVLRLWMNGTEVMRYTNLNYGQAHINQFDATPTWDGYGNGQGFSTTIHQWYSHVRVSFPPSGGCLTGTGSGGTTPPPPPPIGPVDDPAGNPSAPVGLSVTENKFYDYKEYQQFNELIKE